MPSWIATTITELVRRRRTPRRNDPTVREVNARLADSNTSTAKAVRRLLAAWLRAGRQLRDAEQRIETARLEVARADALAEYNAQRRMTTEKAFADARETYATTRQSYADSAAEYNERIENWKQEAARLRKELE